MTADFFRARLDQMIDLKQPLAALAQRLPWARIEAALAPAFARRDREGRAIAGEDLFGPTLVVAITGISAAGRPRLSFRLMAALLYLKHAYNLSDEDVVDRWAANIAWQYFSGIVGPEQQITHRYLLILLWAPLKAPPGRQPDKIRPMPSGGTEPG